MTFRGLYKNGVIVPLESLEVPDGSTLEFRIAPRTKKAASSSRPRSRTIGKSPRRMTRQERLAALERGFGAWKDREDWKGKSTRQVAAELRRKALGRFGA